MKERLEEKRDRSPANDMKINREIEKREGVGR